jgi:phage replication-related protein YjqB (UPF0714/DUF867 family)
MEDPRQVSNTDCFKSFSQLLHHAVAGVDFMVEMRNGTSGIVLMAPHGGGIEPGTDILADTIAGQEHAYYAFRGIRSTRNSGLHIASTRFDEPLAIDLVSRSHTVITIHGCRARGPVVYVGGRHDDLKREIVLSLKKRQIPVNAAPKAALRGVHPRNLCNRGTHGKGVQLEISSELRRLVIGPQGWQQPMPTPISTSLTRAIRKVLTPGRWASEKT